ncbi:hypothetical protein, partial [Trinickia sp.]|uniref:hypothetical protein n=1 Tax=Trinickia sp. TaxID=2571163 RepID=UPI003F818E87
AIEQGSYPEPYVIEHMAGGGFVVAGRFEAEQSAWATGLDESGKVRWRYLAVPPSAELGTRFPYFTGAAAAPNGGVLLCGMIDVGEIHKRDVNGLLVRLDNRGQLLRRQYIRPPQLEDEYAHTAYLDRCVPWGNGAALVGRLSSTNFRGVRSVFHWIIATGPEGDVLWQKLIPSMGGDQVTQVRPMPGGGLLISDTETIRIDSQGELQARLQTRGILRLIQPADIRSDPQLLDCYGGASRGRLVRLTADLHIAEERTIEFPDGYVCGPSQYVMQTYSLADGSIVLFGYHYKKRVGVPGIVKWDPLQLTPTASTYALGNAPWFNAAVPTNKPGVYATVRITGAAVPLPVKVEHAAHVTFFDMN